MTSLTDLCAIWIGYSPKAYNSSHWLLNDKNFLTYPSRLSMIYIQIIIFEFFLSFLHLLMFQLEITCYFSNRVWCVLASVFLFKHILHQNLTQPQMSMSKVTHLSLYSWLSHKKTCLLALSHLSKFSLYYYCASHYYSYLYIGLFFNILQEICRHLGCKHYILVIFVSSFFLSPKTTTIPWLNICFWFKSGQGAY